MADLDIAALSALLENYRHAVIECVEARAVGDGLEEWDRVQTKRTSILLRLKHILDAAEQLQAVTAERDRLLAWKEAEWEAAKHRYCDLPVSTDSLDTATAFVRRWFGQPNKDEATDARELARMFDAVAADAVRNCKETNQ